MSPGHNEWQESTAKGKKTPSVVGENGGPNDSFSGTSLGGRNQLLCFVSSQRWPQRKLLEAETHARKHSNALTRTHVYLRTRETAGAKKCRFITRFRDTRRPTNKMICSLTHAHEHLHTHEHAGKQSLTNVPLLQLVFRRLCGNLEIVLFLSSCWGFDMPEEPQHG